MDDLNGAPQEYPRIMLDSITVQTTTEAASVWTLIYVVLLSFVLSTLLAWVYRKTFRGLSFSRNYVQSIVLISIISSTVIQSVGDSLARGFAIMAAMAIIRFRTNFKDPRDTLFLFASLAAGIACGALAFAAAIIGTLAFSLAAVLLYFSPLGPASLFDGMLLLKGLESVVGAGEAVAGVQPGGVPVRTQALSGVALADVQRQSTGTRPQGIPLQ